VTLRVKASPHVDNWRICFEVEDTGVGMKPDQLDKIFLPFEQVGDSKKQSEGTGLGLAISNKIVSLMDSTLKVKSELGKGSTFWFEVELAEAKNWAESSRVVHQGAIIGYQGANYKILIVDDRWENRSVLVSLLEPINFEVIEASNGQEGLDKAKEIQPDLIITDLVMPVMDGFEMLRRLRHLPEFKETPAIASSASVFEVDKFKSVDAGANEFLPKPIDTEILLQLIQTYLKIEWIYDHKTAHSDHTSQVVEEVNPQAIIPPPMDILQQFNELLEMGDLDEIIEAAKQLEQDDAKFILFARKVSELAENCELNTLTTLIKQFII
jgi:CheY-like chemotaxis protein